MSNTMLFEAVSWNHIQASTLLTIYRSTQHALNELHTGEMNAAKNNVSDILGFSVQPFIRKRVLLELIVLGCAKCIEDCSFRLKKLTGVKFHPISNAPTARFSATAKAVRFLANIIKHNNSHIRFNDSEGAKFLIENYGIPNNTPIDSLITDSTLMRIVNPEEWICQTHVYLCDVYAHYLKLNQFYSDLADTPPIAAKIHL